MGGIPIAALVKENLTSQHFTVWQEEGLYGTIVYQFEKEEEANHFYESQTDSRVLCEYNPDNQQLKMVKYGGPNLVARKTVERRIRTKGRDFDLEVIEYA